MAWSGMDLKMAKLLASAAIFPKLGCYITEDQPDEETSQLPDWFQKPAKPHTPNCNWNKTLPDAHGPVQPWLSSLVQMEDPCEIVS
ncbi:hypothetical protein Tco_0514503 [Tanacetum coccineum]